MTIAQSTCPTCGQPRVPDAMFCHHCGRQLQIRCPNCSAGNPDDSAYCHKCGTRLTAQMAAGAAPPASAYGTSGGFATSTPQIAARTACPRCRPVNDPGSRFCYSCGLPLEGAPAATGQVVTPAGAVVGTPAGFWVRFAAFLVDGIILGVVGAVIGMAMGEPLFGESLPANPEFADYFEFKASDGVSSFIDLAYHVVGWSVYGTTVGKRAFGLSVVRPNGSKLGFGRALVRYLAQILSILTLFVGYLMVAFRKDKRALHDLIADSYVIKK